ncbi:unnamed protein product, partial [Nesidiocoris tenuis]
MTGIIIIYNIIPPVLLPCSGEDSRCHNRPPGLPPLDSRPYRLFICRFGSVARRPPTQTPIGDGFRSIRNFRVARTTRAKMVFHTQSQGHVHVSEILCSVKSKKYRDP